MIRSPVLPHSIKQKADYGHSHNQPFIMIQNAVLYIDLHMIYKVFYIYYALNESVDMIFNPLYT